jgi:hypothetical protein
MLRSEYLSCVCPSSVVSKRMGVQANIAEAEAACGPEDELLELAGYLPKIF